ncbi:MAG: anti-sigma factor family protein [Terriglobales bacterium]
MTCQWHNQLDSYVDTELPEAELKRVESHLRGCPECAADALSRTQLKLAVRASARQAYEPSAAFRRKIGKLSTGSAAGAWTWWPQFATAAAVVLLALALGLSLTRGPRTDVRSEIADLHVATLASPNPVDVVSTDRHTVKPWFEGKLPFTFNLPELQNSPFRLIGGKVTYVEQTPGAQLLFGVRKHQISLFVFPDRDALAHLGSGEHQKLAFSIATWSANGLRYFIITDASPADVHALRELLKRAG